MHFVWDLSCMESMNQSSQKWTNTKRKFRHSFRWAYVWNVYNSNLINSDTVIAQAQLEGIKALEGVQCLLGLLTALHPKPITPWPCV